MSLTPLEIEHRLETVLSRSPDVSWAYLFGSAARGGAFRDVDVGVMFNEAASGPVPFGRLVAALESELPGVVLDVADLASLAPAVAGRIVRERRVLVDREPARRVAWEVETNRRALDIEPWLREFERLRRKAFQQRLESRRG